MSRRKEKVLKTVFQLNRDIIKLLKTTETSATPVSPKKAVDHLKHLNDLDITWEILEKTKIGFSVNDLRKICSCANVKKLGKLLLRKWKELEPNVYTPPPVQTVVAEKEIASVVDSNPEENWAMGEYSTKKSLRFITDTSTCTSENVAVWNKVSSTSDVNYFETSRWSVRFAPPPGDMGLKLIFAKRKKERSVEENIDDMVKKRAIMFR